MNFERTFQWASYGLVGVAFLAVALSGELGVAAPVLFAVAFVGSFFRRTDGPLQQRTALVWTAVLFVALAALTLWSYRDGNWLLHALEFALLMTASRLFQRRFAKDYLQLFALSFLLMLVAAVIHPSMIFAVCFVAYAILAIWSLTMVHLVREIEVQTETGPEHLLPPQRSWIPWRRTKTPESLPESPISLETLQWRQRRLIGGGFLFTSSVMAICALLASMLFFFLFPRLGMGFFYARTRATQQVTGFADAVKLGNFGKIKTSAQVVMRLRFPQDKARLRRSVRLRGLSFDHFDGRNWSRTKGPRWRLQRFGQRFDVPKRGEPIDGLERGYLMHIYLEPLHTDVRVLFAPPRTRSLTFLDSEYDVYRGRQKRISYGLGGDLTFKAPADTSLAYAAVVVEPISESRRRAQIRAHAKETTPTWVKERWLQLPDKLDPRIATLAKTLTAGKTSRLAQALIVTESLRRDWTYSLAGDQDPADPLGDFLFGNKRGHCEYFATSMAVMMRSLGHPARVVNGFLGGQFNDFGDYRMIKQGDAHSWVEVYFPAYGWATFDPTPPAGQLAPELQGLIGLARRIADGGAMLWYTWVVEYDLERQVDVMRKIGRTLRKMTSGLRIKTRQRPSRHEAAPAPEGQETDEGGEQWPWLPAALLTGALAVGVWWWRRRDTQAVFDERLHKTTVRIDRSLRRLGVPRAPWQTWRQATDGVIAACPDVSPEARAFATAWDRARYGMDTPDSRQRALQAAVLFERRLRVEEAEVKRHGG
ncbi:MAG: DUF3488 domain-containing protein [Myxococcales bacterium]|nr:DUF3488 domain-containing protein [Myxococcales bacterium]